MDSLIDELLQGTSRTFAVAIPLLQAARRRQIGVSYLLFRVADSIEDAPEGDAATKIAMLRSLRAQLQAAADIRVAMPDKSSAPAIFLEGLSPPGSPTDRLLHEFPRLLNVLRTFPDTVVRSMCQALNSTIDGMTFFIDASTGSPDQIRLQTIHELHQYCYAVAGIVGELLTDVFVFHHPPGLAVHRELRQLSAGYGEFLQLTNILKDVDGDAASGRVFIPDGISRESVFQLAYAARQNALQYIRLLEQHEFPRDILHFCRFICILADGSLNRLQGSGTGGKLSRREVMQLLSAVESDTAIWPV